MYQVLRLVFEQEILSTEQNVLVWHEDILIQVAARIRVEPLTTFYSRYPDVSEFLFDEVLTDDEFDQLFLSRQPSHWFDSGRGVNSIEGILIELLNPTKETITFPSFRSQMVIGALQDSLTCLKTAAQKQIKFFFHVGTHIEFIYGLQPQ